MSASLAVLALVLTAAPPVDVATLRFDSGDATFDARVQSVTEGYLLRIACEQGCANLRPFTAAVEAPLGLFRLGDGDDLLFSVWASGSAYRVRVFRVIATGTTTVLDAATLGAPTVGYGAGGRAQVRTQERWSERAKPNEIRTVLWTWNGIRFARHAGAPPPPDGHPGRRR